LKTDPTNSKISVENWVNDYSDALFQWAFYKTSSKETAEDLVQDTFLAAYKKIDSFKGNSQPKTWLFSILNNKIIDYYRLRAKTSKKTVSLTEHQGRELSNGFFNEAGDWKDTAINPIWNEDQELLDNPKFNTVMQSCMDDLPLKWKHAVTSKYLTDKNAKAICQDLSISVSNYWQIIHRAKLVLKKCLETNWV